MDFEPTYVSIDKLITWIESSQIALPDFQREFVWAPSKVVDLLDSVSRSWPTGSLLLLQGPQSLEVRPISDAPSLRGSASVLILDGQQRITALYHAIADVSDIAYYIDFNRLVEDISDHIGWERRSRFNRKFPTVESRASQGIAKVSEVFYGDRFFEWLSHAPQKLTSKAQQLRELSLAGLKSRVYKMPVVLLDRDIELAALAKIFETINRTGVRLNAFDLMVAVLFPHGFNLREEWERVLADFPLLASHQTDGIQLLKLIALWERRRQQTTGAPVTVKGIRQGDVLAVSAREIKKHWNRSATAYEQALEMLRNRFGINGAEEVPSDSMTLTLAYLQDAQAPQPTIDQWYWTSIATQSYAQGANTQVISDIGRYEKDTSFASADLAAAGKEQARQAFLEPVRRNGILLNGMRGLLRKRNALDPILKKPLSQVDNLMNPALYQALEGKSHYAPDAAVAEVIFLAENSLKTLATTARSESDTKKLFDIPSLKTQGFPASAVKTTSDKWISARAELLTDWLFDACRGET